MVQETHTQALVHMSLWGLCDITHSQDHNAKMKASLFLLNTDSNLNLKNKSEPKESDDQTQSPHKANIKTSRDKRTNWQWKSLLDMPSTTSFSCQAIRQRCHYPMQHVCVKVCVGDSETSAIPEDWTIFGKRWSHFCWTCSCFFTSIFWSFWILLK